MKKKVGMEGKRNEGSHADASQVSLDDKKGSRVPPSSRETTAREEATREASDERSSSSCEGAVVEVERQEEISGANSESQETSQNPC